MFKRPIRSLRLSVGLLILSMLLASCTFEVQPIEEYTSPDGSLSFEYPAAWEVLMEDPSDIGALVVVGSGPDIQSAGPDAIAAGEAWVQIGLSPIYPVGAGDEAGALTAEKARALLVPGTGGNEGDSSDIESVPLEGGEVAYTYVVPTNSYQMSITLFEPADQVLATVVVMTASGEDDASLMEEIGGILNSIQVRGDPSSLTD